MKLCYKFWDVDYYRMQAVKDVLRVNLCRDLFCQNCQHNLALARQAKYTPILDELAKSYDIFHVVFTVPNCYGSELKATLDKMYSKFIYVNQYMQGKRHAKKLSFSEYGYVGALRALEVTMHRTADGIEYHPHFHTLFLLKKDTTLKKENINDFSFNGRSRTARKFSDFEITLQKMWYIFYNSEKLTPETIKDLKQGYSVIADKCNQGQYHELFKYSIKGCFKSRSLFSYETFNTLYEALHRRKILQGYGVLNKFKFDGETEDEKTKLIYNEIKKQLKELEEPLFITSSLNEVLDDIDKHPEIIYISKNKMKADNGKLK